MDDLPGIPTRFDSLPVRQVFGVCFPVAVGPLVRLRGLAFLDESAAGPGLLFPRCRSIHTFGMRFTLDLFFLDRFGSCTSVHRGVGPGRLFTDRAAVSVLEVVGGPDRNRFDAWPCSGGRETGVGD